MRAVANIVGNNLRCSAVRDFIRNDIDALVAGDRDDGVLGAYIEADDRHVGLSSEGVVGVWYRYGSSEGVVVQWGCRNQGFGLRTD